MAEGKVEKSKSMAAGKVFSQSESNLHVEKGRVVLSRIIAAYTV